MFKPQALSAIRDRVGGFPAALRIEDLSAYVKLIENDRRTLLELLDAEIAGKLSPYPKLEFDRLRRALAPLAAIYVAWLKDGLDEDRPYWRREGIHENKPFENVELFSGRGGRRLLTLADALAAHVALGGTYDEAAQVFIDAEAKKAPASKIVPPETIFLRPGETWVSSPWSALQVVVAAFAPDWPTEPPAEHGDAETWVKLDDDSLDRLGRELFEIGWDWATDNYTKRGAEALAIFLRYLPKAVPARPDPAADATLDEVLSALRSFPVFADGKPITAEAIRAEGLRAVELEEKFVRSEADAVRMGEALHTFAHGTGGRPGDDVVDYLLEHTTEVTNRDRELAELRGGLAEINAIVGKLSP